MSEPAERDGDFAVTNVLARRVRDTATSHESGVPIGAAD
jgi:hypothetical protein